ncbi:MAG TPA: CAP domain-containing protein [Solirubrobacteraceae bacterium]|nr:CAP domain-containing protein [Solirubrobacteraceae bacterium]
MSDHDLPISAIGRRRHRRAVAQLVDEERRRRGLKGLRHSRRLRLSARAWARALARRSRFTHGNFARRVLRFPFVLAARGRGWRVAENLATANGPESAPRRIVANWMDSGRHRENLLGSWQYMAVWSVRDGPEPGRQRDSVIVVLHLGSRR